MTTIGNLTSVNRGSLDAELINLRAIHDAGLTQQDGR